MPKCFSAYILLPVFQHNIWWFLQQIDELTSLYQSIRNTNFKLTQSLEEAIDKGEELKIEKQELENKLEAVQVWLLFYETKLCCQRIQLGVSLGNFVYKPKSNTLHSVTPSAICCGGETDELCRSSELHTTYMWCYCQFATRLVC